MADTATIQVVVPTSLRERIEAVAAREDLSIAAVIREVLEGGIEAREELSRQRFPGRT